MFRSYMIVALRTLVRQKAYSIINILGLTAGLSSFFILSLYISHQMQYDAYIESNGKIYRVVEVQMAPGVGEQHVAITMGPLAAAIKRDMPEVEDAIRIMPAWNYSVISNGNKFFSETNCYYADSSAIDFFKLNLIAGNKSTALSGMNSVVVTRKIAMKYFNTVDVVGKTLLFDKDGFAITGVLEDPAFDSHLTFEILVSFCTVENNPEFEWLKGWGNNSLITYVRINDKEAKARVEQRFTDLIKKQQKAQPQSFDNTTFYLQAFEDVYLHSGHVKFQMMDHQGSSLQVSLFGIIAILVLIIACINFINISIARSVKRAREVGVRKVLGAGRMDLIRQFIGESLVITVFSTLLALVVTELLLPFFNGILNTSLEISFLHNPIFNVGLVLMIMLVSLVSGFYPAFYLSRFQPLQVLKGTGLQKGRTSAWLNKVLVVVQFMVAIGMIFSIVVLNRQFNYVQNKDKGINYDNKAYIPFRQQKAVEKLDIIKTELLQNPQIEEVSGAADINGVSGSQGPVDSDDSSHTRVTSRYGFVDYNFFDMMEIPIKQGRNFSKDFATDKTLAAIVNEAMVQAFGWKEPIGQKIMLYNDGDSSLRYTVVGVISDYHYYSLRNKIEPATYLIEPERYQGVVVKMTQDADDEITKKLMGFIEEKWKIVYPNSPYAGQLVSERLQRSLQQDQNDLKMFFFFTLLAILISCLGLFGLVSLTVEQRTREIGIRKAMGGSTGMIAGHMLKEFIKLVLLAGLFSAPIAWYFSNRLLDEFVYRIHISLFDFLLALLLGVFIALVATGFRALAAARSNPVDALKYE